MKSKVLQQEGNKATEQYHSMSESNEVFVANTGITFRHFPVDFNWVLLMVGGDISKSIRPYLGKSPARPFKKKGKNYLR